MIIGIDDTDSREGMCTTYLGALLMEELSEYGQISSQPLLIRFNPTIPYKTRGNAAVALEIIPDENMDGRIMEHVINAVEELSRMDSEMTNPGVVFIKNSEYERVRPVLTKLFPRTVRCVRTIEQTKQLIEKLGIKHRGFKNGRGLIGALAVCGAMLDDDWDHTYEYLAYREKKNWGTLRKVDEESVRRADKATYPHTWDTVDMANDLVVCIPHSPDPILFGIRGETAQIVEKAASMIICEPVERHAIYRTQQGTDMHLIPAKSINEIKDMHSYTIEAVVAKKPYTIRGGHTIFSISDLQGNTMDCAAYEPTKNFRQLVRKLIPGDSAVFSGSVKSSTLNIEKMQIITLAPLFEQGNPTCPDCGKKMKSAGAGQGYRCKKCRTTSADTEQIEVERDIRPGIYEVPPCARRHLAKPLVRYQQQDADLFPSR